MIILFKLYTNVTFQEICCKDTKTQTKKLASCFILIIIWYYLEISKIYIKSLLSLHQEGLH